MNDKKKEDHKEKEIRRLWNEYETEGFMALKGIRNVAREKMLGDRGALAKGDGNQSMEYKALHEENVLSCWLREDVQGGKDDMQGGCQKMEKMKGKKKEKEREEEKTVIKIMCVSPISWDVCGEVGPLDFVW